jgi:hypothetical protein
MFRDVGASGTTIFIADPKSFYLGTDFGDDPGDVETQDPGQFQRNDVALSAAANFPIDRVHGRCAHANAHVTRA